MSVIDKKGRIFGKLNIIDLIAILLIVAVLALIGYKLLGSDEDLAGSGQSVVYTVEVKGVEPEVYDFIQDNLPSQLTASNEMLDAYVTPWRRAAAPAGRRSSGPRPAPMTWCSPSRGR